MPSIPVRDLKTKSKRWDETMKSLGWVLVGVVMILLGMLVVMDVDEIIPRMHMLQHGGVER